MYGHIHRMAEAVVAEAREVAGTEVALYQVAGGGEARIGHTRVKRAPPSRP